jgi:CBS domain-containing protein
MTRSKMLAAKDIMTRRPVAIRSDASIADAIRVLLRRDISGVPVVNDGGALVGILSERDCLRVIAVGEYSAVDHDKARAVSEFMSEPKYTVPPDAGIYSLADFFLTHHERRLPVIEEGKLVGLVSRRDVLKGIRKMIRRRQLPTPLEQRGPKLYPSATDASGDALGTRLGWRSR